MNHFDPDELHDCGDYLNSYMLSGRRISDAVYCRCNNIWSLVPLKRWRYLKFWRVRGSLASDTMWWREKAAEKARDAAKAVKW